jgi:hypothetical protein
VSTYWFHLIGFNRTHSIIGKNAIFQFTSI